MGYICKKQLSFAGTTYMPGEAIPDGVIDKRRERTLLTNGWIVLSGEASTPAHMTPNRAGSEATHITIPLESPNGTIEASVGVPTLVEALVVLQKNSKSAIEAVKEVTDDDVLMLIDALDSRKTVLEVVKARHDALAAESATESPTEDAKAGAKKRSDS